MATTLREAQEWTQLAQRVSRSGSHTQAVRLKELCQQYYRKDATTAARLEALQLARACVDQPYTCRPFDGALRPVAA